MFEQAQHSEGLRTFFGLYEMFEQAQHSEGLGIFFFGLKWNVQAGAALRGIEEIFLWTV
jgi:hypothetical protein